MKTAVSLLLALLLLSAVEVGAAPTLTLTRDGEPASTIVVAADPTKAALFAALELQWHVQKISGAILPIVREGEPVVGTKILVGESTLTRALGLKNEDFKLREYAVKFLPDTLVLIGRDDPDRSEMRYEDDTAYNLLPNLYSDHASAFAVYDFLEKYCGVRWYRPGPVGLCYPEKATLAVTGADIRRAPMSRYTQLYYGNVEGYDWAAGLQPQGSLERAEIQSLLWEEVNARHNPKTDGGNLLARRKEIMLFLLRMRTGGEPFAGNHSFYGYYDRFWEQNPQKPELWEGAHPEYFAVGYEGKPPQMNFANRGFINQVIKDAREYFDTGKKYPGAQAFGDYFAVVSMDNSSYSKDPVTQAMFNEQQVGNLQFNTGRWSDYIWWFTNEVAKEVRKTHPDKYLVQLAYADYARYPTKIRLEPNIAVQLCLHIRNWWCPSMEVNDSKMLEEWATKEPGRPLYMFNYYCFPQENSQYGKAWHCFPGFFAHAAARQAQLYKKYGVRGIFYCGVPTAPDDYFVTKLYDDPDINIDQALDEYHRLFYGAAAEPMKQLYLKIEQIFGDPKNYPLHIQRDDAHYHQTQELAWGYLGTEKRMAEMQALMDQANKLAQTDMEKRRVLVFQREIWDYMVEGRRRYLEGVSGGGGNANKTVRALACRREANGDLAKVDWTETTPLYGWRQANLEPTKLRVSAQVAHDRKFLYLQMADRSGLPLLPAGAEVTSGDYWQVVIARKRGGDYRALVVNPQGKFLTRSGAAPQEAGAGGEAPREAWESGAVVSSTVKDGEWITRVALPLHRLVPDGVEVGDSLYLNVQRRSAQDPDQPMWISTRGSWEDTAALGQVLLTKGEELAGLDPEPPAEKVTDGLVGWWQFREGKGNEVKDSSEYSATGKLDRGVTWTTGRTGPAVYLNGHWQRIDFGDEPQFRLTGPLTLETWFKPDKVEGVVSLVGRGYGEGDAAYSLHLRPDGSVWLELDDNTGKRNIYNPTDLGVTPGQWNHAVGTYDGQTMRVYLNGREMGSGKPLQVTLADVKQVLSMGQLPQNGPLTGAVDEVALYDRALSREEVWQNYLFGKPK